MKDTIFSLSLLKRLKKHNPLSPAPILIRHRMLFESLKTSQTFSTTATLSTLFPPPFFCVFLSKVQTTYITQRGLTILDERYKLEVTWKQKTRSTSRTCWNTIAKFSPAGFFFFNLQMRLRKISRKRFNFLFIINF